MSISRGQGAQAVIAESMSAEDGAADKNRGFADKELEAFAIHNKGLEEYYGHREWWSWFILGWISILISFNMGLALLVSSRPYGFNFDKLPWFATSITAEIFIQIVGLGTIAAHYLFSDEQKQDKWLRARFLR